MNAPIVIDVTVAQLDRLTAHVAQQKRRLGNSHAAKRQLVADLEALLLWARLTRESQVRDALADSVLEKAAAAAVNSFAGRRFVKDKNNGPVMIESGLSDAEAKGLRELRRALWPMTGMPPAQGVEIKNGR